MKYILEPSKQRTYLSKKRVATVAIASTIGLIFAVSIVSLNPQIMVPLDGSNTQATSPTTPLASTEEASNENETTGLVSESESVPSEGAGITSREEASNENENQNQNQNETTGLVSESESVPSEAEGDQERPSTEEPLVSLVNQTTFSLFKNSSHGISMQYPSNWQITGDSNDYDGIINIAGFYSILEDRFDTYKERLRLSLDTLPRENMTLEEYASDLTRYKEQTSQDFDLLDFNTDSDVLAGYPAYRLVYTRVNDDGLTIKEMETGTKVGDRIYFLTFFAEEEKYDDYLPIILNMINSLEVDERRS